MYQPKIHTYQVYTAKIYSLNENLTFLLRCLLPTFLAPKDREPESDFFAVVTQGGPYILIKVVFVSLHGPIISDPLLDSA